MVCIKLTKLPLLRNLLLWAFKHFICLRRPKCYRKSSNARQLNESIGISPPPGTPRAAPIGYWSIIVPHVCHRPLSVVIRLHSKYRFIAPSEKGDLGAPFELGLFAHHKLTQVMYLMNDIQFSRITGEGRFLSPHLCKRSFFTRVTTLWSRKLKTSQKIFSSRMGFSLSNADW